MKSAVLVMVVLVLPLTGEERYRISTVAGEWSSLDGYSGDGGPATRARLREPNGLAWGPGGDLFIVDGGNQAIRAIDAAGIIRTVAGNGFSHSEGGKAIETGLSFPQGIAFDSKGNLYITESQGHRIRRVSPDGTIVTFAGTGARTGDLGDGGPATQAVVSWPEGIAIDRYDNVYFTDLREASIRKITPDGTIHPLAGGSMRAPGSPFAQPRGLTIDREGNLYVADRDSSRVVRIDRLGKATRYAGRRDPMGSGTERGEGGPALDAYLSGLWSVALDAQGRVLIASDSIWRVEAEGRIMRVLGVNGFPWRNTGAGYDSLDPQRILLHYPRAVLSDAEGNLYVTDTGRHRVLRLSRTGELSVVAGVSSGPAEQEGGSARAARFSMMVDVVTGRRGDLFVVDQENNRVMRISPQGRLHRFAGKGSQPVRNHGRWDPPQFSGDGGLAIAADLDTPTGIALDGEGSLYIADGYNHRIRRVSAKDGRIETIAGTGERGFAGDGGAATKAKLNYPTHPAADRQGNLFFVDSGDRVRKINAQGVIQTLPGVTPSQHDSLAVDPNGRLHFTDRKNHRILRLERNGTLRTIAGTGEKRSSGDGGPALRAGLNDPFAITFDPAGNLLVADTGSIRRISKDGRIRTIAGGGSSRHHVEGGPASGRVIFAHSLAIGRDGRVYLAEGRQIRALTKVK